MDSPETSQFAPAAGSLQGEAAALPGERAPTFAPQTSPAEPGVHPVADSQLRSLDPRSVVVERISWAVFIAIIAGAEIVYVVVELIGGWLDGSWRLLALSGGVMLLGCLTWLAIRLPRRVYDTTRYAVSMEGVEIRRGLWWRRIINVPRSRVQHTDVVQGPLARRFGIGTLIMYTAGTQHASVELPGLTYATALAIREHLIRAGADDAV